MDNGKFSRPRPYRDEERQIEEAFRQVTGQGTPAEYVPNLPGDTGKLPPEETILFSREDLPEVPGEQPPFPEGPVVIPEEDFVFPEEACPREPEPEEPEPEEPESPLDRVLDFVNNNRKIILPALCAVALVLIGTVIAIFAAGSSGDRDDTILPNVMIADVNVGGMTKGEAISAVKQATSHTYGVQDMVVELAGTRLTFSPKDTGAQLDVKAAVNAAYDYGRTGTQAEQEAAHNKALRGNHTIGLLPYLNLDTQYIRRQLESCAGDTGSTLTQPSFGLEGRYPSLSVENFDAAAAQTLVLTMGTPGIRFDVEAVYDRILDAYSLHVFLVTVEEAEPTVEPEEVDLQAIYEEFYVAPVNTTVDMQTFKPIPGSYGYGFDLEAAQKMVDMAAYGEILRIPMEFIPPEQLEAESLFQDILGECRTTLTSDSNRNTNILLASQAMDGTVLQPGETFSYNDCLGQRTAAKGYKSAPAYSGNELVDSIGGGICQGSSTLYYAALLADMEIVERTNHGFPVSYMDYGMDATVSWGGPDFRFRNNSSYPIQLRAQVSGKYLSIQILGTEQRDYYVKMEYTITDTHDFKTEFEDFEYDNAEGYLDGDILRKGVTGYSVKTYKLKYSRENGSLLTRDYEASSRYTTVNRLVARVAEPETTVPETTVPETTVPETTVPETTVPETTVPETTVPETTVPETEAALPPETEAALSPETEAPSPETVPSEAPAAQEIPAAEEITA